MNKLSNATTDRMQVCSSLHFCACLRASRHSRNCPQWSHRCRRCVCRRTHFYVAICHSHLFVDFCIRRYCIYIHERTGKPVSVRQQEQAYSENFVMGSDAAEFVNKVKDQVRNRQKRMSSIAESCDEHSII